MFCKTYLIVLKLIWKNLTCSHSKIVPQQWNVLMFRKTFWNVPKNKSETILKQSWKNSEHSEIFSNIMKCLLNERSEVDSLAEEFTLIYGREVNGWRKRMRLHHRFAFLLVILITGWQAWVQLMGEERNKEIKKETKKKN